MFSSLDVALKKAGIWLWGECLRSHSFGKNCKHANGSVVSSPSLDDVAIHGITHPIVPAYASGVVDEAPFLGPSIGCLSSGFDVDLLDRVFLKPFRAVKSIPPKLRLGFARIFLHAFDAVLACPSDVSSWVQLLVFFVVFWVLFYLRTKRNDVRV